MCRILGAVGPAVALDTLLSAPPFSLEHQAHAPRHQALGRINADGWGVAWYDPQVDGGRRPARYRTATPMWADQRFRDIARFIRSGHVVAAVRNASPGAPAEETGSSPFVADGWAFTHNGYLTGFRERLGVELRRELTDRRAAGVLGAADSEVVFAMVLDRIDAGAAPVDAVTDVLDHLQQRTTGCFNVILTDGTTLLATREGNSLYTLERDLPASPTASAGRQRVVASEPFDDDPGWTEVPEHAVVTITATTLTVQAR